MEKVDGTLLGLFHVVSFYFDFTHSPLGCPLKGEDKGKEKRESDMEVEIAYSCN